MLYWRSWCRAWAACTCGSRKRCCSGDSKKSKVVLVKCCWWENVAWNGCGCERCKCCKKFGVVLRTDFSRSLPRQSRGSQRDWCAKKLQIKNFFDKKKGLFCDFRAPQQPSALHLSVTYSQGLSEVDGGAVACPVRRSSRHRRPQQLPRLSAFLETKKSFEQMWPEKCVGVHVIPVL